MVCEGTQGAWMHRIRVSRFDPLPFAPPYRWLAKKLGMGKPGSVRAYVHAARPNVVGRDYGTVSEIG